MNNKSENARKILLEYIYQKEEELEEFLIGMDGEFEPTYSHRNMSIFSVVRDKQDGRYYYTLLDSSVYVFNKAFKIFKEYMYSNFIYPYALEGGHSINVDTIYDVDSLTSAKTIWELFARMEFTYRALNHLI